MRSGQALNHVAMRTDWQHIGCRNVLDSRTDAISEQWNDLQNLVIFVTDPLERYNRSSL